MATKDDHQQAEAWAKSYVENTTGSTIMPKSRNMAACYLDLQARVAELETERQLARDEAVCVRDLYVYGGGRRFPFPWEDDFQSSWGG